MTPLGSRLALALVVLAACDVGDPSTTGRPPAPRVVSVTWDDGTQDVPIADGPMEVWAPVDVWFDGFLDPDSVTATSVHLQSNEGNPQVVRATSTLDVLDRRVRIDPAGALDPNLSYRIVVTEDVRVIGGPGAVPFEGEVSTGPRTTAPPDAPTIGWGEASVVLDTCGAGSCHGDEESNTTCGEIDAFVIAMGLETDSPQGYLETAFDVPSRQWPRLSRIEPGRPDRSYLVYKVADFDEEIIEGFLMPSASVRGEGVEPFGSTSKGTCCAIEDLPRLHPPPWADPVGKYNPNSLRNLSLANRTPSVWSCACADTRGRFDPTPGDCMVAEGECGNTVDDDGDGNVDCEDADCHFAEECTLTLNCDSGDGITPDCANPDCAGSPDCEGVAGAVPVEGDCDDGADEDEDGETDCDDFDCAFERVCLADRLTEPAAEAVAYCRVRVVSDWILADAPVGPDRDACEQVCAACTPAPAAPETFAEAYQDCRATCLATTFDPETASCVHDALCGAFSGDAPDIDPAGRIRVEDVDLAATCEGDTTVDCSAIGLGSVALDDCEERDLCAPPAALCACGLGGS